MDFYTDFLSFILNFIILLLFLYMFFRLINILLKKHILSDDDIFYITSNPWEYKKRKEKELENNKDEK